MAYAVLLKVLPVVVASTIQLQPSARPEAVLAAPNPSDSVIFSTLRPNRTEVDCSKASATVCRVLRQLKAADVRARLSAGTKVWRDDNEITFATQDSAEQVELAGGLQYPMSRIAGTDLWVVTLRVDGLDSAVVSYFFVPSGTRSVVPKSFKPSTWRGPHAPPPFEGARTLKGKVSIDSLYSRFLGGTRSVVVYTPPAKGKSKIRGVVYMADGGIVHSLSRVVDTLISAGKLPRIMLVGIVSGMRAASDAPDYDPRSLEYLWGYDSTNARFLAHERFWIDEVIPMVESRYGAPRGRQRRATWGVSNGGAWAIQMGIRNPEIVAQAIGFSPGGVHGVIEKGMRTRPPVRYYLQGGTLEANFLTIARSWGASFTRHGIANVVRSVVAGHDSAAWSDTLPAALMWAFPE